MSTVNKFFALISVLILLGSCVYTDTTSPTTTVMLTTPSRIDIAINEKFGEIEQLNQSNDIKEVKVSFLSLRGGESLLFGIIPVGGSDPMRYKSLKIYNEEELVSELSMEDILSQQLIIIGQDTIRIK